MLPSPVQVYVNGKKYITLPHKMLKTIKLDSISGNTVYITAKDGSSNTATDNQQLFINGFSTMKLSSNKKQPSTFLIRPQGRFNLCLDIVNKKARRKLVFFPKDIFNFCF